MAWKVSFSPKPAIGTYQALFQLNIPSTCFIALILSGGRKKPGMKKTFASVIDPTHLSRGVETYLLAQLPI